VPCNTRTVIADLLYIEWQTVRASRVVALLSSSCEDLEGRKVIHGTFLWFYDAALINIISK
jgi:hypothetical protein